MRYFGFLGGADDDQRALRRAVRRPRARARERDHAARDGPAALDPGGDRGDRAAHGPPRRGDHRVSATPAWPAAWRSTAWPTGACCARAPSSGSGCQPAAGRRRRRAGRAPCTAGTRSAGNPREPGRSRRDERRLPRPGFSDDEIGATSTPTATRPSGSATTAARGPGGSPSWWPTARSSACSPGGWSSGRGRSATARSSATPARPTMQSIMNLKIKYRESFRPFAPAVLAERARRVLRHRRRVART